MRNKLSNLFFILGIILLVSGALLYMAGWYFIPVFVLLLVGAIFLLFSIKNWKIKILAIGIPFSMVGYWFYNSFTSPERYLIPENYRGEVVIVFNQKNGQEKEFEGKRRLYRIPQTGVLFTKFNDESGMINQDYYYVSSSGSRIKLGVLDTRDFNEEWTLVKNTKEPRRDSIAIFNPVSMGTIGNSGDPNSKIFTELFVGTYRDIAITKRYTPEQIDSLAMLSEK